MVGVAGFEPATPCSQSRCATKLRYTPFLYNNSDMPIVTIICSLFIAKNEEKRLKGTLQWFHQICVNAGVPFKLALVNDGSHVDLQPLIDLMQPKGYCVEVTYKNSNVQEGKAKKLNVLLKNLPTPFVAVVVNDLWLPPQWLFLCLKCLQNPHVGVSTVLCEDRLVSGLPFNLHGLEFHTCQTVGGAVLVWERQKLGAHGFFIEKFGVYGHEDIEFVRRIQKFVGALGGITPRGYHFGEDVDTEEYKKWKKQTNNAQAKDCTDQILYIQDYQS